MKKLIRNCKLLNCESPRGFSDGMDILVSGGRIESVTATSGTVPENAEVLEEANLLAIPGLVNAHSHSPEMLGRASHDLLPLEPWLTYMENAMGRYSVRDHYLAAMLGAIETMKFGATSILDHLTMPGGFTNEVMDSAMQAYADAGIRASVAPLMPDPLDTVWKYELSRRFEVKVLDPDAGNPLPPIPEQMEIYRAFHDKWEGACDGRLKTYVGPGGIQWCSAEYLHACFDLARELDMGVHTHLMETRVQHETVLSMHGMSAVEFLSREGFLEPRLSLPHSVWLTDRDVRIVADAGAVPVHNPAANMRLGSGFSPIRKFIDAGCLPALGADGCMSGDHQNMFGIVHLAAQIHNSFPDAFETEKWISAFDAVDMATLGGARAMRNENRTGKIEEGYLADITLLDLDTPSLCPLNNAYYSLAFTMPSSSVKHVLVNGELVVKAGRMTRVDEKAIYAECREAAARHMFDGNLPKDVRDEVKRMLADRNCLYGNTSFSNVM